MSRQQSARFSSAGDGRVHSGRRWARNAVLSLALLAGVAACGGDDDDAADSTAAPQTSAADSTDAPDTSAAEITAAHDTTGTEPDGTAADGTADDATEATSGETDPSGTEPVAAGPEGQGSDTTEAPESAAAAAASEPASGTTDERGTDGSTAPGGPTTTGPECEFEENTSLPLERCDMGPAVAVVQSILQANGYAVETVDGNFGDQTLYAVRAFQEDEGIEVDGIVGIQTWSALDVDEQFGSDENGDGVIAPDELDLTS